MSPTWSRLLQCPVVAVQHTDSVPFLAGPLRAPTVRMASAASDEGDAVRALVVRMAPRVLRLARGFMGNTPDAREAALHALIELLRARPGVRPLAGPGALDRACSLAILRFARAVKRRDQGLVTPPPSRMRGLLAARSARTFEQFLAALPEESREALLLRHALGLSLGELAGALQVSVPSARHRLIAARRALRGLVRPRGRGSSAAALGTGAQRWCAQRDREAVGEPLTPDELSELSELEARDAEVWAFVAQVRALELYLDGAGDGTPRPEHRELVDRTLLALQVTSPALPAVPAFDSEALLEQSMEPRGSQLVRVAALSTSLALAAATVAALITYRPSPVSRPTRAATVTPPVPMPEVPPSPLPVLPPEPTVEALPVLPIPAGLMKPEPEPPPPPSRSSRRRHRRSAARLAPTTLLPTPLDVDAVPPSSSRSPLVSPAPPDDDAPQEEGRDALDLEENLL